jgi:predicted Zn-dependent protease
MQRLVAVGRGGGDTVLQIASTWQGNVRWARNQAHTSGESRDNKIVITRSVRGAEGRVVINETTTEALVAAARQAERIALLHLEQPQRNDLVARLPLEPGMLAPSLFSDATYQLDADRRAEAATTLARTAAQARMLSAGDIKVMARSLATFDTRGRQLYFQYTHAEYRVTVRDAAGTGSGWAGVDWYDWNKIDGAMLTNRALDKCLNSQHPVRLEPGRYTTILEPQAVGDFVGCLFGDWSAPMGLFQNIYEMTGGRGPFNKVLRPIPYTVLGEKVMDERITITTDPMDPDLGFPPFDLNTSNGVDLFTVPVYHPVTWIDKGILTHLSYGREFAITKGQNLGLPNSGAFRMSGGTTSVEEMIASTKRGIVVTRFDQPMLLDFRSQLHRGYTRDGTWLVENWKISKPIKNLAFTESILFALNNVEQLGVPQRVYHGGMIDPFAGPQPRVVPPLKIRDFSFTALTDAV